jgi:hypothetical protein
VGAHRLAMLDMDEGNFDLAIQLLTPSLFQHYVQPKRLERALSRGGKRAAATLGVKAPTSVRTRSGDLGEILGTNYVREELGYTTIFKLRWKDHNNLAMRGDDLIAVRVSEKDELQFLKGESKSRAKPSASVVKEARSALTSEGGKPNPATMAFLVNMLDESGAEDLADRIDDVLAAKSVTLDQLEHLLFLFTGSDAAQLLRDDLKSATTAVGQIAVTVRVRSHQKLIRELFDGAIAGA